jgi:hypothetical protein
MAETAPAKPYTLVEDEKATLIMAYTQTSLARGEIVHRPAIRVSTWLRTQVAPEYFHLYNAQIIVQGLAGSVQSYTFQEYFLPVQQIIAYHIAPPTSDPPDYDPSEPNRKMEPVTVLAGTFRLNAHIRMATQSTAAIYLETARENFISLYDVDISNQALPTLGVLHVPITLARLKNVFIAPRVNPAVG